MANVRRFKGEAPLPSKSPARSITINGDFDQWKDVTPEFRDDAGDTAPRDHDGAGGQHYLNRTGRNDLIGFKVAHDALNIKDHELHLSIPRSALAVPDHPDGMIVDFKWVDNTEHPGDIMDFYVSGDVAPVGRFRYRYTGEPVTPRPR